MESLHSPSYSTGKGPQHAAVIVSSLILTDWTMIVCGDATNRPIDRSRRCLQRVVGFGLVLGSERT